MRTPPTLEARDNLAMIGLLAELPNVGEPLSAERRSDWLTACERLLTILYPVTSPVDTAPRGYVEHGPGGPQAVYHAETPDDYLEHGDRP